MRGAGEGVTSCPLACICAVIVITPATVPVCTPTSVAPVGGARRHRDARRAVRRWRTQGRIVCAAIGRERQVSVTTTSTGKVLPSETPTRSCCSGLEVAEMPPKFNGGVAGSTKLTPNSSRCWRRPYPSPSPRWSPHLALSAYP